MIFVKCVCYVYLAARCRKKCPEIVLKFRKKVGPEILLCPAGTPVLLMWIWKKQLTIVHAIVSCKCSLWSPPYICNLFSYVGV